MTQRDPYQLDPADIAEPPATLGGCLRHVGPGLILSASVVGSGELVATTILGARTGFAALWVILASCLVKVAIQLEFGRHTIQSGHTCMEAIDSLPGPRLGRAHWTVWFILLLQPIKVAQMGGILGGLAIVLTMIFGGNQTAWIWAGVLVTAVLVAVGRYRFVESVCLTLLGGFTLLTLASVVSLAWTPYSFTLADLASGLRGALPEGEGALFFVIGTFGLTGVGGDEIMHYAYWLLEKGYAAKTGPYAEGDEDWNRRARGWIRVMYVDAIVSMLAYTLVTCAFYVLGAAVLHARGEVPEGYAVIETLSTVYTESLGPWGRGAFLAGAFIVLFSSCFAASAAWSRAYTDALGRIGLIDFRNLAQRNRTIVAFAWAIPTCWALAYLRIQDVVNMVVAGGVATAAILLIVVYAGLVFRYRDTLPALKPGRLYDAALWTSAASIFGLALYTLWGAVS